MHISRAAWILALIASQTLVSSSSFALQDDLLAEAAGKLVACKQVEYTKAQNILIRDSLVSQFTDDQKSSRRDLFTSLAELQCSERPEFLNLYKNYFESTEKNLREYWSKMGMSWDD